MGRKNARLNDITHIPHLSAEEMRNYIDSRVIGLLLGLQ
jgi:hypothetical protein